MIREFWAAHQDVGFHPDDRPHIPLDQVIEWHPDEIGLSDTEIGKSPLKRKVHANLWPAPFAGRVDTASIVILTGNPGFHVSNYTQEFSITPYREALQRNLSGQLDFLYLSDASAGTDGGRYWVKMLRTSIRKAAQIADAPEEQALQTLRRELAVVESFAYHSKRQPQPWWRTLPSTQVAREWVQEVFQPRALSGEASVLVKRGAKHWNLTSSEQVHVRKPKKAFLGSLLADESDFIAEAIARAITSHAAEGM